MKKVISLLVTVILIFAVAIPASSATSLKPEITVLKYNGEKYEQLSGGKINAGDFLQVRIAFNQTVASLASLRVRVDYSTDSLQFIKGSIENELDAGNSKAGNPITGTGDGFVQTYFSPADISSNTEIAKNVKNIVTYGFFCSGKDGATITINATLDNALTSDFKDITFASNNANFTTQIVGWSLDESILAKFRVLENLNLDEKSLADIQKNIQDAERAFAGLSSTDQTLFAKTYSDLYGYFTTAWTRYYDLAKTASEKEIEEAANEFKTKYADVLSLTEEADVTSENYLTVLEAFKAINSIDKSVVAKLASEKALLKTLNDAALKVKDTVKKQKDASEFLQMDFIDGCAALWNADEDTVSSQYSSILTLVASAEAAYNNLGPENLSAQDKEKAAPYLAKLANYKEMATAAAEAAGEKTSVLEEVNNFTTKWFKVIKLNSLTVGIKDETAIELMIKDFSTLSASAQDKLSMQKQNAEQMLEVINSLKNIKETNKVDVPAGGTTNEITKEVIKEVPVEKQVPVEVEKEVPVEVQTQTKTTKTILRKTPTIIIVMSIVTCVALLSLFAPYLIKLIKAKKNKLEGGLE